MIPTHQYFDSEGFRQSYYEWGNPNDPTILFVHATGMHGRIWDKVIKALPSGYHVIAVDQRGHGQSVCEDYLLDWSVLGRDAARLVAGLDLKNVIAVGHSLGAHALTQAALMLPDRFSRLMLIDPVIFSPDRYDHVTDFEKGHPTENPMSRRRNQFDNWEDMNAVFSKKPPYCDWDPEVLENYCLYGSVTKQNGKGVGLACRPDIETSVYMGHCSVNLTSELSKITLPVLVLRGRAGIHQKDGRIDFAASPTWSELAAQFPNGKDVFLAKLDHFIPMQEPELVAHYIVEAAA